MPGADPTQDLFAEDLFPQGLKYQAGFVGPEEEESCCVKSSAFRSGNSSFTVSPASAERFHSAGAMISTAAASRRQRTCRNSLPAFVRGPKPSQALRKETSSRFSSLNTDQAQESAGLGQPR